MLQLSKMDNHNYCKAVNIEGVQVKATFQSRVVVGGKWFKISCSSVVQQVLDYRYYEDHSNWHPDNQGRAKRSPLLSGWVGRKKEILRLRVNFDKASFQKVVAYDVAQPNTTTIIFIFKKC